MRTLRPFSSGGGPAAKRQPSPEGLGNPDADPSAVGAALNRAVSLGAYPDFLPRSTGHVGASAGGILIRRYQQQYPHEIAGLVFVDSAHEEQEWRMAAISKGQDPNGNNPEFLRENGFLPDHQKLTWHADIPLIVLERTEKPPCSAFPGLSQQQCDALNDEWHNHQVDLAGRSKYGQLRSVAGSGHFMHQQRPDAIADAIQDVVTQVRSKSH